MAKRVFSSTSAFESFFTEIGFVKDDGKWYWGADTTRASYLDIVFEGASGDYIKYIDSSGAEHSFASFTGSGTDFLLFEYFELKNGGVAFRCAFNISSAAEITAGIQYAAVEKEDGSGFVYFIRGSATRFDDLSGVVSIPSTVAYTNITDTSSLVILAKIYDNRNSFIDARARSLLASQSIAAKTLYTFTCGGKNYIGCMSDMGNVNTAIKGGSFCFEIE